MSTTSPPAPVVRKSRRRWLYLGAFVLLVIVAPFGLRSFADWQRERELAALYAEMDALDPNWRWLDLVASFPAPPPDDQNAAVQMLKVRDRVARSVFGVVKFSKNAPNFPNLRLPEKDAAALRAALGKLDAASLEETRKLKDMPDGRFPIKMVENPFEPPDHFSDPTCVLDVMQLLEYDAMRRADDGDTEGAAESCQARLHAINAINDAPSLMALLIRVASRTVVVGPIERTLGHGSVSEDRLKDLQFALAREAEFNVFYHALRGARALDHRFYLLLCEGKIPYPAEFRRTGWQGWIDAVFPSYSLGDLPDELRLYNELIAASKLEDEAQTATLLAVQPKKNLLRQSNAQSTVMFIASAMPEHPVALAQIRCAVTAIAAERYRLEHGRWPDSATELVKAGFLKAAYKDPFDGQPLRWKCTPRGLIIYSVGPDRTDNDGKLDRRSAGLPGTDVGFELWRPSNRRLPAPADPR
jgi:hypothetical protein